ncbi:heavy metal transport/detoxification protein [Thermincola ferriacetica]|uniref:Copper chaperone CopZ n=2 Tax=Thermincola TaxID=278993 RepID=D5XDM0_THEPJ|nr:MULTISPECIES: copper ion binding protein [Thermincola]ADG83766.1 Heavy metal transport/detoxification protein [Thermincola potens JR]KNZ69770.1 heavy metal transport/detoxification protein [Thermincola ferriacetica]
MTSTIFTVEGVACQHCKKAVEMALQTLEGVKNASLNLEAKTVDIEFDPRITNEQRLKDAIKDAGYAVK